MKQPKPKAGKPIPFGRGKEGKRFPPKKPGMQGDDGKRSAKSPLRKGDKK